MPGISLVVVDLDGTLLDASKLVRPEVKETVSRLKKRGVHFSIATGRSFASAVRYARELGIKEPIITGSGALVRSAFTNRELYDLRLPTDTARAILQKTRRYHAPTYVFLGDRIIADRPSAFSPRYSRSLGMRIELSRDILCENLGEPAMIVMLVGHERAEFIRQEMALEMGEAVGITSSTPFFVDFLHPEASKERGVEILARYLGVARDAIMAVGDGFNDLGMLDYAGVGVLVRNAPEALWPQADYVTQFPSTEGVLEAIERFCGV